MKKLVLPDTASARILVVGDVMLDRYWFGEVSRISPEAPVPVVKVERTEERPGGAANVARNKLDGLFEGISPAQVHEKLSRHEDFVFLDVRTPEEYEQQRLPHATLVPLGALRERLQELPRDRLLVLFCDISLRAYEGALILKAAGFRQVKVMEGGMAMWPFEKME